MLLEAYRLYTFFSVIHDELSRVFISVVGYKPWTDTKCTK